MKKIILFYLLFSSLSFSQDLRINEVMSSNFQTLLDDDGDESDWIELVNTSSNTINLNGFYLTDDQTNPLKWQLPNKQLLPNQFVLIYASDKDKIGDTAFHANFKLSKNGSYLGLFSAQQILQEEIQIPALNVDISYGKQIDGTGNWVYFSNASPKNSNNNNQGFSCLLTSSIINQASGNYPSSLMIDISHPDNSVSLKYSLNGQNPSNSTLIYSAPFAIDNQDFTNYLSVIPTNPAFNFPLGNYSEIRANTRGWVPPFSDVKNIANLQVQAFKVGCISSPIEARTYLIQNEDSLPVLSIFVDSLDFFSNETGIYVYGDDTLGNYNLEGNHWERKVKLDYFNLNKELVFSENAGVKISGHGSRHSTIKNLQIDFRDQYGNSSVDTILFPKSLVRKYESLSLRSGGHRPDCLPRDDFSSNLFEKIPVDHSEYEFVNVYINGEYWGIHALKERMNKDYLSEKYNIEADEIILLENAGTVIEGHTSDEESYADLIDFVETHDLNLALNYLHVDSLIDIPNFRDYLIAEMFIGNADWPNSNIKFWKKRGNINTNAAFGHDGKWRWLLYDLDGAFGGTCNDVFTTFNTLTWAHQTGQYFNDYTKLIRALTASNEFKISFINRACDLMNSSFLPSVSRPKLDAVFDQLNPEILNHINRWRYPSTADSLQERYLEAPNTDKWNYLAQALDSFLFKRPDYLHLHMKNFWNLSDSAIIQLDVNDVSMGEIQLNSIILNSELEGVNASVYPWNGLYVKNINIPLKAIAKAGFRFVNWLETGNTNATIFINLHSDSAFTAIFEVDPNFSPPLPLKINEVMAKNVSIIADENSEYDDWIEIYNPNNFTVNLKDFFLTDDASWKMKYRISNNLAIPAHGFQLFWCDKQSGQGVNHTNFSLNNSGEFVALIAPNGEDIVDSISYPILQDNNSYGRQEDANPTWIYFQSPTPNFSNQLAEMEEVQKSSDFEIYPNPLNSEVLKFTKQLRGEIYSIEGNLILSFENVNAVKITKVQNGIYYLKTKEGICKKFVVLR